MRSLSLLFVVCLILRISASAAEVADPALVNGLNAWSQNGVEAGLRTWYSNRPELEFEMKEKLLLATQDLGTVIDTEVVAIQRISTRVTRYYVAVYFTRTPLWLMVERYASDQTAFYLPLKFSTDPDRILPGYLTEFQL
jgi:hypothetical protein